MTKPTIDIHFRHWLRQIVIQEIAENGPTCDLNHLNVGEMQDISGTFKGTNFNGNVSRWNIGMACDIRDVFADCPFSGDLSQWDVNVLSEINGFLSPTFKGVLPALRTEPAEKRTAAYIAMFDGVGKYDKYLSDQPFGALHAAFLVDTEIAPTWLSSDELMQACNVRNIGLGLGLKHDELCALVQDQHRARKFGVAIESLGIDFSQ